MKYLLAQLCIFKILHQENNMKFALMLKKLKEAYGQGY